MKERTAVSSGLGLSLLPVASLAIFSFFTTSSFNLNTCLCSLLYSAYDYTDEHIHYDTFPQTKMRQNNISKLTIIWLGSILIFIWSSSHTDYKIIATTATTCSDSTRLLKLQVSHYRGCYCLPTKLREGNVFHMCLSFCPGGSPCDNYQWCIGPHCTVPHPPSTSDLVPPR